MSFFHNKTESYDDQKQEFNPESALSLLMCTVRIPPKNKVQNKNFFEIIQAGKVSIRAFCARSHLDWLKNKQ